MIFTPEESREIAEGMLHLERDDPHYRTPWNLWYRIEDFDFSLPEWTGPMLEAVLHDYWDQIRVRTSKKRLAVIATRWYDESREFFSAFTNRNLFDAWKWLREPKETSRE